MRDFFETLSISETFAGDFSLLVLLLALSIFSGLIMGRVRLVRTVAYVYIAYTIVSVMPTDTIDFSPYASIGIFLAIVLVLNMIGNRVFDIHARPSVFHRGISFVLGVLVSGAFLGIVFRLLPQSSFFWDVFSERSIRYFSGEWSLVLWLIAPIVFLITVQLRRSH
jgi:hypothetical protein